MKKIAIIVAAGEGKRFGSFKQTKDLNGKPLFSHSLDVFHNSRKFESIFIVVHKEILQEIIRNSFIFWQNILKWMTLFLTGEA